jgi:hypothetical protein
VHNLSTYKNNPQVSEIATALLQAKEGYQPNEPPLCHKEQDLPPNFFSHNLLNARKKYYQQATYKDEFPMFPQPSAVLFFQEIDHFNTIVTKRSTYNEPLEICP